MSDLVANPNCWFSHAKDQVLTYIQCVNVNILLHRGVVVEMKSNRFIKICVFVLWFSVPVNNFSVMSGQNHHFLGINQYKSKLMCLAKRHDPGTKQDSNF